MFDPLQQEQFALAASKARLKPLTEGAKALHSGDLGTLDRVLAFLEVRLAPAALAVEGDDTLNRLGQAGVANLLALAEGRFGRGTASTSRSSISNRL